MSDPVGGIRRLVAEILTNKHASSAVIEQACRLVIADVQFNSWCARQKDRSTEGRVALTDDDWLQMLDECEAIEGHCRTAYAAFLAAEWPRGAHDVWTRNLEMLTSALVECTERTERLRVQDR